MKHSRILPRKLQKRSGEIFSKSNDTGWFREISSGFPV
jgi:hypothetical protein